jgi:hypothetical protein
LSCCLFAFNSWKAQKNNLHDVVQFSSGNDTAITSYSASSFPTNMTTDKMQCEFGSFCSNNQSISTEATDNLMLVTMFHKCLQCKKENIHISTFLKQSLYDYILSRQLMQNQVEIVSAKNDVELLLLDEDIKEAVSMLYNYGIKHSLLTTTTPSDSKQIFLNNCTAMYAMKRNSLGDGNKGSVELLSLSLKSVNWFAMTCVMLLQDYASIHSSGSASSNSNKIIGILEQLFLSPINCTLLNISFSVSKLFFLHLYTDSERHHFNHSLTNSVMALLSAFDNSSTLIVCQSRGWPIRLIITAMFHQWFYGFLKSDTISFITTSVIKDNSIVPAIILVAVIIFQSSQNKVSNLCLISKYEDKDNYGIENYLNKLNEFSSIFADVYIGNNKFLNDYNKFCSLAYDVIDLSHY